MPMPAGESSLQMLASRSGACSPYSAGPKGKGRSNGGLVRERGETVAADEGGEACS